MGSRAANGLVISESYSNLNVPLKCLMLVKVALKRDPINGVIPHLAWYCPIYKMEQRAKTIRSFICALSLPFQLDVEYIYYDFVALRASVAFCVILCTKMCSLWLGGFIILSTKAALSHSIMANTTFSWLILLMYVCRSLEAFFMGTFCAVLRPKGRRFSLYDGFLPKLR